MLVAGVDAGSSVIKVAIMAGGALVATVVKPIKGRVAAQAEQALEEAVLNAGRSIEDLRYVVSSGVEKDDVRQANETATGLTCDAYGSLWVRPTARTVINVGAETCHAARFDRQGKLVDFAVTDKCATGTGIFLETVASMMEVSLADLAKMPADGADEVTISTMCAVFAESEVVTEVHRGTRKQDILRGVYNSVAYRASSLVRRVNPEPDVLMVGGVAQNGGVVAGLRAQLGLDIIVPDQPQLVGAIGAAIIAHHACLNQPLARGGAR
ncbi:MAG: 2-hydroxyglutaryl-CoA dehydratase [Chloroflexi bacterium]|nr:2-hydroxyglutaryl-CoA dehydratase [Chloroflexota bacterium]